LATTSTISTIPSTSYGATVGGTVNLTWNPVTGGVAYMVFYSSTSDLGTSGTPCLTTTVSGAVSCSGFSTYPGTTTSGGNLTKYTSPIYASPATASTKITNLTVNTNYYFTIVALGVATSTSVLTK
jgi:hypothetical protein